MSFNNKSVIILGGLGGLGKSIGQELIRNGIKKLAVIDILIETDASCQEILTGVVSEEDVYYIYKSCSVTNQTQLKQVMNEIKEAFERIDIIINSVGIANELNHQQLIDINFTGTVNSTLIGIELMRKDIDGNFGGTIINISSVAGLRPIFFLPVYSGTKHAVLGFTRSLTNTAFHDRTGINFIVVCPGATHTPILGKEHVIDKFLFPEMLSQVRKISKEMNVQEPETVSKCVVMALEDNTNGSVWQCENGRIEKLHMHQYPQF